MALSERQKSGLGQFLETTLYETGLAIMHPHAANYFMHGKPPPLTGNEHPNLVPYAIFPTRTDNIFIGVGNDGTFRKLAKEIGKPELGTDPRFARNKDRIANRDALRAELAAVFSQHDAEPLCDRLLAAGLPAGPVQSIDQALTSAHTVHRGDVIEKDWYKGVASPIRLERSKPSLRSVPPKFSAARHRGADGIRLFQRRDRGSGRQGRGLRAGTQALRFQCPGLTAGRIRATSRDDLDRCGLRLPPIFPLPLARASPVPSFRLYGHLHVIRRCYRAKRR